MEDQKQNYEQKAKESLQKLLEEKLQVEKQVQNVEVGVEFQPGTRRQLSRIYGLLDVFVSVQQAVSNCAC